tara:strand:- start:2750 stop:3379 length:630 start_codon:yes stop_codon:yes gene_type:complete
MNLKNKSIVIIANGSSPKHSKVKKILLSKSKFLFCDGAINNKAYKRVKPFKIIGDLDSISNNLIKKYESLIISEPSQNTNDLYKALDWCKNNNFYNVTIIGASGKREDHFMGNVFLLFKFSKMNVKLITDEGTFIVISKNTTFKSYNNQQVSIFSVDPKIKIKSKNLKFALNNISLNNLYEGTLNSSTDDIFNLNISHGSIIVFQTHNG